MAPTWHCACYARTHARVLVSKFQTQPSEPERTASRSLGKWPRTCGLKLHRTKQSKSLYGLFLTAFSERIGAAGDRPVADFRVIEGGAPDKDESKRQQAREWAEHEFSWAIREVSANTLRILRGAGKPDELLLQMKRAIDAAVKYQETHSVWPGHLVANELQIESGVEKIYDGVRDGRHTQASIERWEEDGTFEKMHAEHIIQCGALQTIASELLGQSTQKSAGKREFRQGINDWVDNHERQVKKSRETARAAVRVRKINKKSGQGREPIES